MGDEPNLPDRPDNLFAPLPGERGAHGRFDARARDFSPELWASKNCGWLAVGAAGVLCGLVMGLRWSRGPG